jgi:hypothetical protein
MIFKGLGGSASPTMFRHSLYAAITVALVDLLCTFEVLTTHRTLVLTATTFAVTVIVAMGCVMEETAAKEFHRNNYEDTTGDLAQANLIRLGLEFKNSTLMKEISSLRKQLQHPVEISTVPTPAIKDVASV